MKWFESFICISFVYNMEMKYDHFYIEIYILIFLLLSN